MKLMLFLSEVSPFSEGDFAAWDICGVSLVWGFVFFHASMMVKAKTVHRGIYKLQVHLKQCYFLAN